MPTRLIRDGILSSEAVSSLNWASEVFYRRLMSVADDHGRFYATPTLIRSACYPLQIDRVSDSDIGKWLTACVEAGLVRVYPAQDGKRYIEILKFGQQVRSKSKYPEPIENTFNGELSTDNTCKQLLTDVHLDVVEVEVGYSSELQLKTSPTPTHVAWLPLIDGSEYGVSQNDVAEWSAAFPGADVAQELLKMRVWLNANQERRKTKRGVTRFVIAWLGKVQDSAKPRTQIAPQQDWMAAVL